MKIKKLFLAFAIFSIFTTSSLVAQSYTYSMEMLLYATQQNHPELLKLQEEYKRSLLDVKDAWASVGPTLDLQASGTYMLNPPVGPVYINTDDIKMKNVVDNSDDILLSLVISETIRVKLLAIDGINIFNSISHMIIY